MASRYWVSTGGDWGSTASWSTTDGGSSGAAVPVTGDDVYFMRGAVSVTAGLSQAAVDLESLTVNPEYTGSFGTPGSALTIAVSNSGSSVFKLWGSGAQYNIAAGTNGIDVLDIRCQQPNTAVNLSGGTTVAIRGGKVGVLNVEAGAVVTGPVLLAGMVTNWSDNATDVTGAVVFGAGTHRSYRDMDDVTIDVGASLTTYENVTVDTSITIAGLFDCRSTGTIAALVGKPTGVATSKMGPGATVTAATVYQGFSFFTDSSNMTLPVPTRAGDVR